MTLCQQFSGYKRFKELSDAEKNYHFGGTDQKFDKVCSMPKLKIFSSLKKVIYSCNTLPLPKRKKKKSLAIQLKNKTPNIFLCLKVYFGNAYELH